MTINGATVVAGVVGAPVAHSLSPLIHNAWIEAAGLDAVYVPFTPPVESFKLFVRGLRGGAVRGLNVTVPFKETALDVADVASEQAQSAGAANLLIFELDGTVRADNTDGLGLLYALEVQTGGFDPRAGPVVILGAGGAARGAAAALVRAGAPEVRLVNRTVERADAVAKALGPQVRVSPFARETFEDAALIVNATTLGLGGGSGPLVPFEGTNPTTVVMDMVYRPLRTEFACRAVEAGLVTVDGLAMLIGQAIPSFEAFYGVAPPAINVRALCLTALGESP